MIIRAIFLGENGSLGYLRNQEYWLLIQLSDQLKIIPLVPNGQKMCIYDSLKSFLNNWKVTG